MIIVDDLWLQIERLMSPSVIATLVIAGWVYGWFFLGAFVPRSMGRLWAVVTFPGIIFIIVIWIIRYMSGAVSVMYPVLLADWFIFATVGVAAVAVKRRQMP